MRIGVILMVTDGGFPDTPNFGINVTDALKNSVEDLRSPMQSVFMSREKAGSQAFDGSDGIAYYMKFLGDEGRVLAVIKSRPSISGRPGDNTAIWLHFPAAISISNEAINGIVDKVVAAITNPVSVDREAMRAIAENEYPIKAVEPLTITSSGDACKAREYGKGCRYSQYELIGRYACQKEYENCKGVFFIDKEKGYALNSTDMLIAGDVKPIVTVPCPGKIDGFTPYIDGKEFKLPFEAWTGTNLKIEWKREDYKPVEKKVVVGNNDVPLDSLEIKPVDERYLLQRSRIEVQDMDGKPLSNYMLFINKRSFTTPTLDIHPDDRHDVRLKITKDGYEDKAILWNAAQKVIVKMKKTTKAYKFTIPAYDGDGNELSSKATVTLETTQRLADSPIKGYYCDNISPDKENELEYSYSSLKEKLLYAALGAAVCGLAWVLVAFFQTHKVCLGWPPIQAKETSAPVQKTDAKELQSNGANDKKADKKESQGAANDNKANADDNAKDTNGQKAEAHDKGKDAKDGQGEADDWKD